MVFPLKSFTICILYSKVFTRLLIVSKSMLSYTCWINCFYFALLFSFVVKRFNRSFLITQKFSMGEISGEFGSHPLRARDYLHIYFITIGVQWNVAPSCWNKKLDVDFVWIESYQASSLVKVQAQICCIKQ